LFFTVILPVYSIKYELFIKDLRFFGKNFDPSNTSFVQILILNEIVKTGFAGNNLGSF